jgi:hypothetical protein
MKERVFLHDHFTRCIADFLDESLKLAEGVDSCLDFNINWQWAPRLLRHLTAEVQRLRCAALAATGGERVG